jgi:Cys-rich protein (TIGR01571 family)
MNPHSVHNSGGYTPPVQVELNGVLVGSPTASTPTVSVANPMYYSSHHQVVTNQPNDGPPVQPFNHPQTMLQANNVRSWSTSITDCMKDEESCWWGTWCCFILSARTTEAFEVGSAKEQIYLVIGTAVLVAILLHFQLIGMVLLILLAVGSFSAFRRAAIRVAIRHKLAFAGSYFSDFLLHCCCSCCSVCQESREAAQQNTKIIDYCSGQELKDLAVPDNSPQMTVTASAEDNIQDFSIYPLYFKLSHASQLILKLCGAFFLYISIRLSIVNPSSLGILLLVFVQPLLILYYFYWRSRRKHAQLDYVVKLFAVGFFMATTQSMFFEVILQYLITFVAGIVFYLLNPSYFSSSDPQTSQYVMGSFTLMIKKFSTRASLNWYNPEREAMWSIISLLNFDVQPNWEYVLVEENKETADDTMSGMNKSLIRKNILLLMFVLFMFAFVVAAGVEETMKHFTVRCCRFPAPLKDPHAILVYLMAGALGFATAENIEYVFGTKTSPIHGTSVFVGELFVLFLRICMPIHLICSVLQAANLSRVGSVILKVIL